MSAATKKKTKKIAHIGVIGRVWFNKMKGHSYHTAEILVDGARVAKTGPSYGGGNMYEQSAVEWLVDNKYLPFAIAGQATKSRGLSYLGRELGFKADSQRLEVPRKGDL